MKKLIFIFLLFGKAFAQCGAGDTVTVNTVTNITTSSATISGTFPSNDSVTAFTLHYVRVGYGDTVNTTAGAFSRNITGLLSNTLYRYYWTTECGVGTKRKQSGYYTFRTLGGITYTPMTAAGYEFKYLKADTGFALPLQDTAKKRSVDRAGLMVYKSGDGVYVFDGGRWKFMPDAKFVSSPDGSVNVTESGDSIYLTVTGTGSPLTGSRIISAPPMEVNTDTVSVIPNIIFSINGAAPDTITTGADYKIRTLSGDSTQTILVYISQAGTLDTLQGVISPGIAVPPTSDDVAIILGYIDVSNTVDANNTNTYQNNAVVYVKDGKLFTDSIQGPVFNHDKKTFRVSSITTTEMNAISSPEAGDLVFNNTENAFYYYNGSDWTEVSSSETPTIYSANGTINSNRAIEVNDRSFKVFSSDIDEGNTGIYFDPDTKEVILGDSTNSGTNLNVNSGGDITLNNNTGAVVIASTDYRSHSALKMLVRDTVSGIVYHQAIPSGGSTDTTNFLTKTATQTATGQTTFNNTSVGSANTIVTGGVQGVSDNVGLLINGTFAGGTNAHPLRVAPTFSPTSNSLSLAGVDVPIVSGGTSNMDRLVGFQSVSTHGSSGTMNIDYGAYISYVNNGGRTGRHFSYYAANPTGSGVIDSVGMFYAEAPTKGSSFNYAFFGAGAGKLGLTSGNAELGGMAIVGFGTGTAPGAQLEVRRTGAVGSRIRNNANWWQLSAYSGSTSLTLGDISGSYASFHNGGGKTFYRAAQDSADYGQFMVNQAFGLAYRASTSTFITLNTNDVTFNGDATAGNVTVNLPTAVGCKGRIYEIRKSDNSSNTITVDANGTETMNGVQTFPLTKQDDVLGIKSDNANWMILYSYLSGEAISTVSTYTNYTTTATYQNIASITLAPGTWEISAFGSIDANSATLTATANSIFVISTTTASASGATEGLNMAYVSQAALSGTANRISTSIAPYTVTPTTSTTYYLNTQSTFLAGNPQFTGTIRAVRLK